MSNLNWFETLYRLPAAAAAVANSTSELDLVPEFVVPVGYFVTGRTLYARMNGIISNIVTTPGTLTLRARIGGLAGTLLCASAAISLNIVAQTNDQWEADFRLTCLTEGASGSVIGTGKAFLGYIVAANVGQVQLIPTSGAAAATGLNLLSALQLAFTAQFSIGNAGNSIQVQQFELISGN